MHSRAPLFIFLLAAGSLVLPVAAHAMIPFFGPIIDQSWTVPNTITGGVTQCALGWGAVITVINNIIEFLLTIAILFVAPVMIAYSGFLLVTGQGNPSAISKAKGVLLNTIVGIVIALAGWLIVDAIMTALTTGPNGPTFAQNWSSLVTSGNALTCLPQQGVGTGLNQATPSAITIGTAAAPSQNPNNVCTTAALQSAGWGTNAAAMSCVTKYENAPCDPNAPSGTDKGADGNVVSWGIYQVNISADNLNYSACQATNNNQPLNCTQAFSGGAYTSTNHATTVKDSNLYNKCVAAVENVACNTAAAQAIFNLRKNSGQNPLSAWGTAASQNCSSLLSAVSPWQSLLASVLSSFERL